VAINLSDSGLSIVYIFSRNGVKAQPLRSYLISLASSRRCAH
jgi:hypothetical protein